MEFTLRGGFVGPLEISDRESSFNELGRIVDVLVLALVAGVTVFKEGDPLAGGRERDGGIASKVGVEDECKRDGRSH